MEFRDKEHRAQVVDAIIENLMETYSIVPMVKPTGFLSVGFMALDRQQDFDITIWSPINDWYEQIVACQQPEYEGQQLVLSMREQHDLKQYRSALMRTLTMVNAILGNTQFTERQAAPPVPRPIFRRRAPT